MYFEKIDMAEVLVQTLELIFFFKISAIQVPVLDRKAKASVVHCN